MSQIDICTTCGKEQSSKLWGAECCGPTVHIGVCRMDDCGNEIGYVIDDDYCGPEALVCTDCIKKARANYVQPRDLQS